MSFDRGRPGSVLGKITTIGLPYHGLATGGSVTLPNAASITYPTPVTGDVYVVRRPGWTAPTRTTAQLAADATAGYEWRDYALIAGTLRTDGTGINMQAGGKRLDGWIWFDPEGQPWRVRISNYGSADDTTNYEMAFEFSRFGVFGGDPDTVARTTPGFSLLQGGADEIQHRPTPGSAERVLGENDGTHIRRKLLDITPDGSKALFAAFCLHYHADRPSIYVERVVAIYEITIATDGAVSGATIRSRAACLGTVDWQPFTNPYRVTKFPTVFVENNPPLCTSGVNYDVLIQEYGEEVADYTAPGIGLTNTDRIRAAGYISIGEPASFGIGALLPHTRRRAFDNIVVGAYYVGTTATVLTVSASWDDILTASYTASLSSYTRRARCVNGVYEADPGPTVNCTSTATRTSTLSVSLKAGGAALSEDVSQSVVTSTSALSSNVLTGSLTWETSRNGATVHSGTTPLTHTGFWSDGSGGDHHLLYMPMLPLVHMNQLFEPEAPQNINRLAVDVFMSSHSADPTQQYRIAPAAWNQTTYGTVAQRIAAVGVTAQHEFTDATARGVSVPSAQTFVPAGGNDVIVYPLGSYQPISNEWSGAVGETLPAARAWV